MRRLLFALAALSLCAGLHAAGKKDAPEAAVIGTLNGPSGIPSAYLMDNVRELGGVPVSYETFATASQMLPKLLSGELAAGFLPPNVAAKVFTTGNGAVVSLGVAGDGMLSLISGDPSVQGIADLRGRRVAVAGQGATPEYVLRYILAKNGIPEGSGAQSVELDFSIPNNEIAAAVISGKISCAVVPEPFSTVAVAKDPSVRRVLDLQEEFIRAGGSARDYPMTLIVGRADFVRKHPEFASGLQEKYNEAQAWTKQNPQQAGESAQRHNLGLAAQIVAQAIPFAHFTYEDAASSRKRVEDLLAVFLRFAPESVGGALPAADFYYSK